MAVDNIIEDLQTRRKYKQNGYNTSYTAKRLDDPTGIEKAIADDMNASRAINEQARRNLASKSSIVSSRKPQSLLEAAKADKDDRPGVGIISTRGSAKEKSIEQYKKEKAAAAKEKSSSDGDTSSSDGLTAKSAGKAIASSDGSASDMVASGLLMSGNPYAMAAGGALKVLGAVRAKREKIAEQKAQAENDRRARLESVLSRLGSGVGSMGMA